MGQNLNLISWNPAADTQTHSGMIRCGGEHCEAARLNIYIAGSYPGSCHDAIWKNWFWKYLSENWMSTTVIPIVANTWEAQSVLGAAETTGWVRLRRGETQYQGNRHDTSRQNRWVEIMVLVSRVSSPNNYITTINIFNIFVSMLFKCVFNIIIFNPCTIKCLYRYLILKLCGFAKPVWHKGFYLEKKRFRFVFAFRYQCTALA